MSGDYSNTSTFWAGPNTWVAQCQRNPGLAFVSSTAEKALDGLVSVRKVYETALKISHMPVPSIGEPSGPSS